MPFSNIWVAKQLAKYIPTNSVMHFGILHSFRSWSLFPLDKSIRCYCNSGGFGIDGPISSTIGASLFDNNKLYFLIVGDLAFFYDINSLGNRHIGNNVRIMLFNNGCGTEFRNYNHPASKFGDDANCYMAAGGHYGNKSKNLVKHYAEDLGFKYLTACNKEEFIINYPEFVKINFDQSIVFEVFTDSNNESDALYTINHIVDKNTVTKIKDVASSFIGHNVKKVIKGILNK